MTSHKVHLELISSLYEAALDPQGWSEFLEKLSLHSRSSQAALFFHNISEHAYDVAAHYQIDPEYQKMYTEHYGDVDAWYLYGKEKLTTGSVLTGQELCRDEVLLKTEFYNDCLKKFDIFHQMGGQINQREKAHGFITLLRPKSKGEFAVGHLRLLQTLMPHLQRATALHGLMADLRSRAAIAELGFQLSPTAIILADARGKVILANEAAERFLRSCDGLMCKGGRLSAINVRDSAGLREALRRAILSSQGKGTPATAELPISRGSTRDPLMLHISPVAVKAEIGVPGAAVAIVIRDPEAARRDNLQTIAGKYGLTNAETRVIARLLEGKTLKEIADELQITKNTAKTHLHRIFGKMGVSRQAEVIRLVSNGTV